MSTPAPTPWVTTPFEVTTAIDRVRSLRVYGDDEFPADDPENEDYWIGVVVAAAMPLVWAGVIFPLCYWWFLCCRNGCCKIFKCCPCPCFRCCCAEKHEGCRANLVCIRGAPLRARFMLFIGFAIIIGLHGGLLYGFNSLTSASDKVSDSLVDVGDVFTDLDSYMQDWSDSAYDLIEAANGLNCTEEYASELGDEVKDLGWEMANLSSSVIDLIGDLPDKAYDLSDKVSGNEYGWLVITPLAIGFLFAAVGLLGTICFESADKRCCKFASSCLLIGNCIAIPLMFCVCVLLSAELLIGYPVADFCARGPAETLADLAVSQFDDGQDFTEVLTYYTSCSGENPMQEYYDDGVAAAENVTELLDDYKDVFISESLCCETSWVQSYGDDLASADPDELEANCLFYGSNGCTVDNFCTYNGSATSGLCSAGAACDNSSYVAMHEEIDYILLDEDGPLNNFYSTFECATINPILEKLLSHALCTDTMDGLYYLIGTHAAVVALMSTTLIFSSFVRQAILRADVDDSESHSYKGGLAIELPKSEQAFR